MSFRKALSAASWIVGCVGLITFPLAAVAQIEAGDFHIAAGIVAVSYTDIEVEQFPDADSTNVTVAPGGLLQLGYSPSEQFELGAKIGFGFEEFEVSGRNEKTTNLTVVPYAALNIPVSAEGRTVLSPSIGVGYSGSFENLEGDSVVVEVGAELKFFVAKDASIDLGLTFQYTDGEIEVFGIDLDRETWSIGPQVKISIWP